MPSLAHGLHYSRWVIQLAPVIGVGLKSQTVMWMWPASDPTIADIKVANFSDITSITWHENLAESSPTQMRNGTKMTWQQHIREESHLLGFLFFSCGMSNDDNFFSEKDRKMEAWVDTEDNGSTLTNAQMCDKFRVWGFEVHIALPKSCTCESPDVLDSRTYCYIW